uniref:Tyr recombinase domain-containing protein n=1 Tax=Amphimedon queenslandica TaxID=400682 RepID=A0A1X7SY40_AMPQE
MLAVGDEAVDSHDNLSYITVCIKKSENDQLTHGIILHVGKSNWRVCAVSAVVSYLAICPASPGPSFICEDEIVLSRHRLGLELSSALQSIEYDSSLYKAHSFRIGAETAAARAGLSDSLIQTRIRWKSLAFMEYIRVPMEQLVGVAGHLVA